MTSGRPQIRIWDWTIRLFHWLAVLLVGAMWWTAEQGLMDWHRRLGLTLLGLLVYRIIWGLIGPRTARFSHMLFRPAALAAYVRDLRQGTHRPTFGHNPAGTLSVFALLLALLTQVGSGLFSVDTVGLESGPLARFVSFETGRLFAEMHEISFLILRILILVHILAVAVYLLVLRDNILRPMITGNRAPEDFGTGALAGSSAPWPRILIAATLAAATVTAILTAGG